MVCWRDLLQLSVRLPHELSYFPVSPPFQGVWLIMFFMIFHRKPHRCPEGFPLLSYTCGSSRLPRSCSLASRLSCILWRRCRFFIGTPLLLFFPDKQRS